MLSPILDSSERSGGAHSDFSRRVKPIAAPRPARAKRGYLKSFLLGAREERNSSMV